MSLVACNVFGVVLCLWCCFMYLAVFYVFGVVKCLSGVV